MKNKKAEETETGTLLNYVLWILAGIALAVGLILLFKSLGITF